MLFYLHCFILFIYMKLVVQRTKTVIGTRAFAVAAATVWNRLPAEIRTSTCTAEIFAQRLKTFYASSCIWGIFILRGRNWLIIIIIFAHQHKAAGVKTKQMLNNGCNDFFFFFLLLFIERIKWACFKAADRYKRLVLSKCVGKVRHDAGLFRLTSAWCWDLVWCFV